MSRSEQYQHEFVPDPAMKRKRNFGPLAMVAGLGLCVIGVSMLPGPTEYQAAVKMRIEPDPAPDVPTIGSYDNPYDPYFFETELKAISSDIVLSNVVETLDLNTEWGKRDGRSLDTAETIKLLRPRMDLSLLQNTKIVEIRVTDEDPNEAARIANGIAKAYLDYRIAQHSLQMTNGIKMLEEDLRKEETKISLMQSNVDSLRQSLEIHDTDPVSAVYSPTINNETVQHLNELMIEDEANYVKLNDEYKHLQSLQATNPAALRDVLPMLCSDGMLAGLLRELDDNTRKLAAETNAAGGASSGHAALQDSIVDINKKIDARMDGIMSTLQTRVDGAESELNTLSNRLKQVEGADMAELNRGAPYWEAKMNLESEKSTHDLLKAKIEADKEDAATIPRWISAAAVDPAVPPTAPSGPNRKLGAVLLVFGLAMTGFGFNSLRRAGIREETGPKPV
jgi:uncharacterized protein involved in exopolysaccharide biosynthesis